MDSKVCQSRSSGEIDFTEPNDDWPQCEVSPVFLICCNDAVQMATDKTRGDAETILYGLRRQAFERERWSWDNYATYTANVRWHILEVDMV